MNHRKLPGRLGRRACGFTLIEVTLAIGIVGVGLLSTLGLMSVGLSAFHSATDRTIHAQITQQLVGTIRQTDFSRLDQFNHAVFYFDDQGLRVTDSAAIAAVRYAYIAQLRVGSITMIASPLPMGSQSLATAKVEIQSISSPLTPFVITTVISDNGS